MSIKLPIIFLLSVLLLMPRPSFGTLIITSLPKRGCVLNSLSALFGRKTPMTQRYQQVEEFKKTLAEMGVKQGEKRFTNRSNVFVVPEDKLAHVKESVHKNSIEVLFAPTEGRFGHIAIRVDDTVLHMTGTQNRFRIELESFDSFRNNPPFSENRFYGHLMPADESEKKAIVDFFKAAQERGEAYHGFKNNCAIVACRALREASPDFASTSPDIYEPIIADILIRTSPRPGLDLLYNADRGMGEVESFMAIMKTRKEYLNKILQKKFKKIREKYRP